MWLCVVPSLRRACMSRAWGDRLRPVGACTLALLAPSWSRPHAGAQQFFTARGSPAVFLTRSCAEENRLVTQVENASEGRNDDSWGYSLAWATGPLCTTAGLALDVTLHVTDQPVDEKIRETLYPQVDLSTYLKQLLEQLYQRERKPPLSSTNRSSSPGGQKSLERS